MAIPRSRQICLQSTRFYHCTTRIVRRSFLCGFDRKTQTNYEHRRAWIEDLIHRVSEAFCIQILTYAVMSNHYHLVVYINPELAQSLTAAEVAERWGKIWSVSDVVKRFLDHEPLSDAEYRQAEAQIETWRSHLANLSKLMAYLNQKTSRRANKEDKVTGHFWEDRFASQALLGEEAVVQCMAYVDLNAVRAKMHDTPEASVHTGIHYRLNNPFHHLMPFDNARTPNSEFEETIPCEWEDYLQLVDWTGKAIVHGKRGSIPMDFPSILTRIGLSQADWMKRMVPTPGFRQRALGTADQLKAYCRAIGQKWFKRPPDPITP